MRVCVCVSLCVNFFFVKDFSGTTVPRILKFATNIGYDKLYCVLKNQPHMAYQSLYSSIFLSFQIVFFVKDFSGTTVPRISKFGTNIGYDKLYCFFKNQPHMAYQSLYLSIFLSFQFFFHLISSASICARVFKFCIHNEYDQVYN